MIPILTPNKDDPNVSGSDDDEIIVGDSRSNNLNGFGGDDTILGARNNDFVIGGRGRDVLVGGQGFDFVAGGTGNDILEGGADADQFSQQYGPREAPDPNDIGSEFGPTLPGFFSTAGGAGIDTIIDFNELEGDYINLEIETAIDGRLAAIDSRGFLDSDQNGIINNKDAFVKTIGDGTSLEVSVLVEHVAGVQITGDHRIILQGVKELNAGSIFGSLNDAGSVYNPVVLILTPDTLPDLSDKRPVANADINGVDRGQFVTAPVPWNAVSDEANGDASITFVDESAGFQSSLGVYLIGENGEILNPKIVFARIDESAADDAPEVSSVASPKPGDAVLLSELYDSADLTPGTEFGLFLIADGFAQNSSEIFESGSFQFRSDGHVALITDRAPILVHIAEDGTEFAVQGEIMHTVDAGSPNPLSNSLNPSGEGQVLSGIVDGEYIIAFEDQPLGESDRDFGDVLVAVDSTATVVPTDLPPPTVQDQFFALIEASNDVAAA